MISSSFSLVLLTTLLPSVVLGQYGNPSSTATSAATSASAASSASASNIHQVAVGKNGLVFTPDTVTAAVGDTIEFTFAAGHSVTRSDFANPCQAATTDVIFSGFPSTSDMFALKVNDTNPIWLYCAQVSHCQGGMAMVVNPPSSGADTLAAYKAAAGKTSASTAPKGVEGGLLLPVGAALASGSGGGSSGSSASAATSAAASSASGTQASAANTLAGNMKWTIVSVALLAACFLRM